MSKGKRTRKSEAVKRAKNKKILIITACASAVLAAAAIIILAALQPGAGEISAADDAGPVPADMMSQNDGIEQEITEASPDRSIDLDMSRLGSTMRLAELNRIYMNPDSYVGNTIKLSGYYFPMTGSVLGQDRHFIALALADSCCPMQGFDFIWDGENAFPGDNLQEQAWIEIIGVFDKADDSGTRYFLTVDDLQI